jgi:hypothetical protein
MLLTLLVDVIRFLRLCLRPAPGRAAENLFLRKQLALYQERHVKPRRATDATRLALVRLARWFDWRQALAVVQPATFVRWHRQGFRLFWRWQSRSGRPRIPRALQMLIHPMARDNPTRGQERIVNELLLKLGLRVSPRTVRQDMPKRLDPGRGHRVPSHAGGRLCASMPRQSSRVISALWSRLCFAPSMRSWSWNTRPVASCTARSRHPRRPRGRSSGCATPSQPIIHITF